MKYNTALGSIAPPRAERQDPLAERMFALLDGACQHVGRYGLLHIVFGAVLIAFVLAEAL